MSVNDWSSMGEDGFVDTLEIDGVAGGGGGGAMTVIVRVFDGVPLDPLRTATVKLPDRPIVTDVTSRDAVLLVSAPLLTTQGEHPGPFSTICAFDVWKFEPLTVSVNDWSSMGEDGFVDTLETDGVGGAGGGGGSTVENRRMGDHATEPGPAEARTRQ